MIRYIDADALTAEFKRLTLGENSLIERVFADGVYAVIETFPTADVVEVRHGRWYHGTEHGAVYAKCSACGRKMNYSCYGYAYCALCGAKMDGERSEDTE